MIVKSKNIYFKRLSEEDITQKYINWMNNYNIVKYTESKGIKYDFEIISKFILSVSNQLNYLFGIYTSDHKHIGNIKIGNINERHHYADIGLIIGDDEYWGKGIATEAIRLSTEYAFDKLHLHSIFAGIYENNRGSIKAFEKNDYFNFGIGKEMILFENRYINCLYYQKINMEK